MKSLRILGVCLVLSFAIVVQAEDSPPKKNWSEKMRDLKATLIELLPYMSSEKAYLDKENESKIGGLLKKLGDYSHRVANPSEVIDADPTLPIVAGLLQGEIQRVRTDFEQGRKSYSRSILRTVPGYCVACHSRSEGTDLSLAKGFEPPANMSKLDRAEAFISVRAFDRALGELQGIVTDQVASQSSPFDWERAVRLSLLVLVRVKGDPTRALEVVEKVIRNEDAPQYLKEDAVEWKKSLTAAQKEIKRKFGTEEGWFQECKRLLSQAQSMQKYPADRAAEMSYLRLSSTVHQMMRLYPKGRHFSEGMMMMGMAYEALRNLDLWSYHEILYEGCVRSDPHTNTSKICYARLEESVFIGYTGSAGFALPSDVKNRLDELKKLAYPEPKKVNP